MTSAEIGELAADRTLTVHELAPLRGSLEDAFMELTRDAVEFQRTVPGDADPTRRTRTRGTVMTDARHRHGARRPLRHAPGVRAELTKMRSAAVDVVDAARHRRRHTRSSPSSPPTASAHRPTAASRASTPPTSP